MSAIVQEDNKQQQLQKGSVGLDGIRRYKTRCKVLVDSHSDSQVSATRTLFEDVIAVSTSKTLKGAGNATVTLIPSKNYLNLIFPNDYINIYFDIGDGSGWTRTFFGFIDRVEESYAVDEEGTPSTTYTLYCTDFYKAFERTMIYFNPQLSGREDFTDYDFAKINIGGLALMSKGIVAGGAPPDIVINVLLLLIGFGTQFLLPSSYNPGSTQERLRKARANLVLGRLSEDALEALGGRIGGYEQLKADKTAEAATTINSEKAGSPSDEEARITAVAKTNKIPFDYPNLTLEERTEKLIQLLADKKIRESLSISKKERGTVGTDEAAATANVSIIESVHSEISSLSDILDVFTFVERRAMDGFMFGQPVWQKQGSLASILRSYSNEAVNELFFDLRPLSAISSPDTVAPWPVAGAYSRAADDKTGNIVRDENDSTPDGITYIPAVIMREYPFSTIEGLDLRHVNLQLKDEQGKKESIGLLYFGAIFSDRAGEAGRHVINLPGNLNIADIAEGKALDAASKHLDVALINEDEIIQSTLGRSDNDHFNLFEFYSDNILGSDQRFYMKDMLPVITPIHILRNGIRVRSVTTRAARFSLDAIRNFAPKDIKEASEQETDDEAEEVTALLPIARGNIDLPLDPNPSLVRFYNNQDQANWGWRIKALKEKWVFHQGIDISRRPLKDEDGNPLLTPEQIATKIPIKAIADGWVVISCPNGGFDGYGNVVVIKHNFEGIGTRYSVYAHLESIAVGAGRNDKITTKAARTQYCSSTDAPGTHKGSKDNLFVEKGTVIGFMGNTGFSKPGSKTKYHLHFEIDRHFPPRKDSVTPRLTFEEWPGNIAPTVLDQPTTVNFDTAGVSTSQMRSADQRSADPVRFFAHHYIDLQQEINKGATFEPQAHGSSTANDIGDNSREEQVSRPKSDVGEEEGKELEEKKPRKLSDRKMVDTAASRTQIIRWALLQDHWYQHNLEYLSGGIDMRGAPEIRVGYRLDVREKNMSYYVEGVNHSWQFPGNMTTSLAVSRGQPNNPYPLYVYPAYKQMNAPSSQRRTSKSRLATYFVAPDPIAIRRSLFIKNGKATLGGGGSPLANRTWFTNQNGTDSLDRIDFDEEDSISYLYGELVSPAGSREYTRGMEAAAEEEEAQKIADAALTDALFEDKPTLAPVTGQKFTDGINKEDPSESK